MNNRKNDLNFDTSSVKGLAFKGGKVLFLRHLLGFAINFSGGIVLARFLGPEVLGLYFISYTLLVILRQLIDFGIGIHFIRLPSFPTQAEVKNAFAVQQWIGLLGALVTVFAIGPFAAKWYGHTELVLLIGSAGVGAYFNSWQSISLSKLERDMDYKKVGVIEVAEPLVFNLASVILILSGMGILGLAVGNILRGFVPGLISLLMTGFRPAFFVNQRLSRTLAAETYPLLGSNLVLWVILLAPAVLVGTLAGTKALGMAQLAYAVLGHTMFIANIFQRVSLTSLAKFQDDMERFNRAVLQVLQLLFIVYIPFTMGIASLSPWLVPMIYGKDWVGMESVMLVAALPFTSAALLSVLLSALLSKGLTKMVLKQNIVHALIYWAVMGLLATRYGAVSVPLAHLAAMSAGYIFIKGYARHCGKIAYGMLGAGFLGGAAVMFTSWFAVKNGYVFVPFILWPALVAVLTLFSRSSRQTMTAFINNIGNLR